MRYINNLDEIITNELERIIKEDIHYRSRHRAKAILLSNEGKEVKEIANIFDCNIGILLTPIDNSKNKREKMLN